MAKRSTTPKTGPPRGIKAMLKRTALGKLVKARGYTCYRRIGTNNRPTGPKLGGVAKRLHDRVFRTDAALPVGHDWKPGGAWRGANAGTRPGAAVDAQVSKLASQSQRAQAKGATMRLSKRTLEALKALKLTLAAGQRVVLDAKRGIGTAADLVATRGPRHDELVILELKTGYAANRKAAATDANGRAVKLRAPLSTAADSILHRHLAQLAATHALFKRERGTLKALQTLGITKVSAAVLYVAESRLPELYWMPAWWEKRGPKILDALGGRGGARRA